MVEEIISIVRKRNGLSLSFASGETHPGIKGLYYDQTINLHNSEIISLDFDSEDGMWLENASDALIATIYDKIKSSNMGTKAFIIIRLEDSDQGRIVQFTPKGLPYPVEVSPTQKDPLPETLLDGKYFACHHLTDSYPEWLGEELKANYNDRERIINLISGGIYDNIKSEYSREAKKLPDGKYCIKNSLSCSSFLWEMNRPTLYKDFVQLKDDITHNVCQFAYLFDNGKWRYLDINESKQWEEL